MFNDAKSKCCGAPVYSVPEDPSGEYFCQACRSNIAIEIPYCPECGERATYQTPDGTFWDSAAHYWREEPMSNVSLAELWFKDEGWAKQPPFRNDVVATATLRKLGRAVESGQGADLKPKEAAFALAAVIALSDRGNAKPTTGEPAAELLRIEGVMQHQPVPEFFEPDPNEAGWMVGSNGVRIQGGHWTTRANYDALLRVLETRDHPLIQQLETDLTNARAENDRIKASTEPARRNDMEPELRDLKCEWDESTQGHPLLRIEQTHGDNTTTTLWLTRLQAQEVWRVIEERYTGQPRISLEFTPVGEYAEAVARGEV